MFLCKCAVIGAKNVDNKVVLTYTVVQTLTPDQLDNAQLTIAELVPKMEELAIMQVNSGDVTAMVKQRYLTVIVSAIVFSYATIVVPPTPEPTMTPTFVPSVTPTTSPSFVPSVTPTFAPSSVPTTSAPTSAPSFVKDTVVTYNVTLTTSGLPSFTSDVNNDFMSLLQQLLTPYLNHSTITDADMKRFLFPTCKSFPLI